MAKKYKKRETRKSRIESALKWIVYPPAIAGALLFGSVKKKRSGRRKK